MTMFGARNLPESMELRTLVGALRSTPTGNNLLLGQFVIPRAQHDPETGLLAPGDGTAVLYVDAGVLYLYAYTPETGWQRVALS